ncbi:hypothetical protein P7C70_g1405, partial [Phenoliferia sp. Uapishka_3]
MILHRHGQARAPYMQLRTVVARLGSECVSAHVQMNSVDIPKSDLSFQNPFSDSPLSLSSSPTSTSLRTQFKLTIPAVPAHWKVPDAFVFTASDTGNSWLCRHPSCVNAQRQPLRGRKLGIYAATSPENVASIKKRAWEHTWRHRMADQEASAVDTGTMEVGSSGQSVSSSFPGSLPSFWMPKSYNPCTSAGAMSPFQSPSSPSFNSPSSPLYSPQSSVDETFLGDASGSDFLLFDDCEAFDTTGFVSPVLKHLSRERVFVNVSFIRGSPQNSTQIFS